MRRQKSGPHGGRAWGRRSWSLNRLYFCVLDGLFVLLPELELFGPQSVIADLEPVLEPALEPVLLSADPVDLLLGLVLPEPLVVPFVLLDPFVERDAMLPGPQSVLLLPIVLVLGELGLVVSAPLVLVCASAAVPSVNAMIDAAVRTSRCILFPPLP